jgi:hypothetical protein
MSLSEAVEVMSKFALIDTAAKDGHRPQMTRREAEALTRLLTDATITLNTLSRGDRRPGRRP